MSKYSPMVNKPENVAAAYWNGGITREECQLVFDEYGKVITAQGQAIVKMDMVIAFLCEKFGFKPEDVEIWAQEKAKLAEQEHKLVTQ